jgi:hypothetical protein
MRVEGGVYGKTKKKKGTSVKCERRQERVVGMDRIKVLHISIILHINIYI